MTAFDPQGSTGPTRLRPGGDQVIPRPADWQLGRPAPWLEAAASRPPLTVAEVIAAVPAVDPSRQWTPTFADARASAVLVALGDGPEGAEVLLTRRSRRLTNHSGEISFPGGRVDTSESAVDAARREAWEEVALPLDAYEVCGELDHLSTLVSKSYIVPIVARLTTQPELRPNPGEVERVMFVPLAELVRPDTHREERWMRGSVDMPIQFFELDDETVWGATARILRQLLCLAYGVSAGPPAAIG